jgi:hypothetical protein
MGSRMEIPRYPLLLASPATTYIVFMHIHFVDEYHDILYLLSEDIFAESSQTLRILSLG